MPVPADVARFFRLPTAVWLVVFSAEDGKALGLGRNLLVFFFGMSTKLVLPLQDQRDHVAPKLPQVGVLLVPIPFPEYKVFFT